MKKIFVLIAVCLATLFTFAQDTDENAVAGQYIIHLRSGISAGDFFKAYPAVRIESCISRNMNIWLIHSDDQSLLDAFKLHPGIIAAQSEHTNIKRRSLIPNDTLFGNQWNMRNLGMPGADISAPQAWDINHSSVTRTGDSVVIAVIDGTFDIYHKDIHFFINRHEIPYNGVDDDGNGYIDDYKGWNVFMNNDSVYALFDDHGTHIAGIAAAIGDDSIGVAGVCWGAQVLAIDGSSTVESDVLRAYDYVIEMRKLYDQTSGAKGAFIVATNSSFGVDRAHPAAYPVWCALYDTLGSYGIISATATANNNYNVDAVGDIPTECPSKWMIAVTNTTTTDMRYTGAAYGPTSIDIGAPGTVITSTYPGNSYGLQTGTSMASPHIAGAMAAMIANACPQLIQDYFAYPDSIALILRDFMLRSVDPLPTLSNVTATGGRLNLYHAFLAEKGYNCNNCDYNIALAAQNIICNGDSNASIIALAGSGAGYHYAWSTGDNTAQVSGLKAGFYQLTVTDTNGCQRSATTVLRQPQRIRITNTSIVPFTSGSSANVIFTVNAGTDTLSYQLDSDSIQSSGIFIIDSPGVHHFYIRNSYGCELDTTLALFYTGIAHEPGSFSYFAIAPNPASGSTDIILRSEAVYEAEILLTDLTGRVVTHTPIQIGTGVQKRTIDLSAMADGIYILSISTSGRTLATRKLSVIR